MFGESRDSGVVGKAAAKFIRIMTSAAMFSSESEFHKGVRARL